MLARFTTDRQLSLYVCSFVGVVSPLLCLDAINLGNPSSQISHI